MKQYHKLRIKLTKLQEIGITENSPSETIFTTYTPEKKPYNAAIGVKTRNKDKIKSMIFTDTQTYQNIQKNKAAVVNIVEDAKLLVKLGLPYIFPENNKNIEYIESETINAPYLTNADAVIELKIKEITKKKISDKIGTSEAAEITGLVKNIQTKKTPPRPFKRSELYLIETAVLATKAIVANKKENPSVFQEFVKEIKQYEKKCEKIARKSEERKLITKIKDYLLKTNIS